MYSHLAFVSSSNSLTSRSTVVTSAVSEQWHFFEVFERFVDFGYLFKSTDLFIFHRLHVFVPRPTYVAERDVERCDFKIECRFSAIVHGVDLAHDLP